MMPVVSGRGNIRLLLSETQQAEFTRLLKGTAVVKEVQFFNTHRQNQLNIIFVVSDLELCHHFSKYASELAKEVGLDRLSSEELRLEAWVRVMPFFHTWKAGIKMSSGRRSGLADVIFLPADWRDNLSIWTKEYYSSVDRMMADLALSDPMLTICPPQ